MATDPAFSVIRTSEGEAVHRCVVRVGLLLAALLLSGSPAVSDSRGESLNLPPSSMSPDERIVHTLNRLGFGPRPGDLDRVRGAGLASYIESQLHPEGIGDVSVEARLDRYDTLDMTPQQLQIAFPTTQLVRTIGRQLTTRMGMDPDSAAVVLPELSKKKVKRSPNRIVLELSQAKLIRAIHSERQLQEVMTDFWFNHFNVFIGKGADRWWTTAYERDAIRPHALGRFRDMLGEVARHPAMLFYLDNWLSSAPDAKVDGWTFQWYTDEAILAAGMPPGGLATLILRERGVDTREMERRLVRQRRRIAKGRGRPRPEKTPSRRRGLNENYARELLELHTLGVDGGYTQRDIVEVARCFSGWTLLQPQAAQEFVFIPELHDRGTKTVLGKKIPEGGADEGEAVLDLLAAHPATARFVSSKLARRFVSDTPSPALVDEMAKTFIESKGDIRSVLRTMIESREFWSPETVGAKIKSPFEFVVSLVRAVDGRLLDLPGTAGATERPGLIGAMRQLGQPLYASRPPTGYPDSAEAWISAGSLLNRFKVGLAIAYGRLPGVEVADDLVPDVPPSVEVDLPRLADHLFGVPPSAATMQVVRDQLELSPDELRAAGLPAMLATSEWARERLAATWLLTAPGFQRR